MFFYSNVLIFFLNDFRKIIKLLVAVQLHTQKLSLCVRACVCVCVCVYVCTM
jgi:hypothetical protein